MNIFLEKTKYPEIKTIGIGLTNLCNLNCAHCYSRKMVGRNITIQDVSNILSTFPNLKSVNFGTGESILNKDFEEIVNIFYKNNIKLAITSNGLTIDSMSDELLKKFDDVDISIDFPIAKLHDEWRGQKGLFEKAMKSIGKCKKHNINVSITSVLMSNNYKYFAKFKDIIKKFNIYLRINVYKAVNEDKFVPSYDQFWHAIKTYSKYFDLVSCSEPVLSLVSDDVKSGSSCGNSVRIHPDGAISSCVYVKDDKNIDIFNKEKKVLPEYCKKCEYKNKCMGGCYGRRLSEGRGNMPDLYCPISNNKAMPNFRLDKKIHDKDLIHGDYLCTIILK